MGCRRRQEGALGVEEAMCPRAVARSRNSCWPTCATHTRTLRHLSVRNITIYEGRMLLYKVGLMFACKREHRATAAVPTKTTFLVAVLGPQGQLPWLLLC